MSLAQDHVLIPPIAHHVHLLMLQTVGIPCQLPREMGLFARLGTVQWMVRRVLNTLIARRILQQHPGHCIHFSNPPPSPAGYLRLGGLTDNGTLAFMSSRSAGMFAGSEQKLHTNDRSRIFFKSPSAKSLWEIQSGIAPSVPLRQVPDNKAPPGKLLFRWHASLAPSTSAGFSRTRHPFPLSDLPSSISP